MQPDSTAPAVLAEGLTRRFGTFTAVDSVNLSIPRAAIYGFLGPNGSGKSTTIRMLCGLLLPTAGTAQVLGRSVPSDAEALKHDIGYMTQRFSLYEDLDVLENLDFITRVYGLPRARARERVAFVLSEYHLEALTKQRAGTLSGGQKQRLALAAATLHEPQMLFLDEPTSAVDPQSRRDFWESLFQLVDRGTTILVSTHYMDEAERCHALAILDHGRVVAQGAPMRLIADIHARVIEIEAADARAVRKCLEGEDIVHSMAQFGLRLRVLVEQSADDPVGRLRGRLDAAGIASKVSETRANLEDVFVAATAAGRRE